MKLLRRYRDILIASVIALTAGSASIAAFERVSALERPTFTLLGSLHAGENHFALLHQGTCIGRVAVEVAYVADSSSYSVLGNGALRTTFRGVRVDPSFKFQLYFNPLGQFTIGEFKLNVADSEATVMATEANPIKIAGWIGARQPGRELSTEIPGPLLFAKVARDRFSVGYPVRGGKLPTALKALLTTEADADSPLLEQAAEDSIGSRCPLESADAYDLTTVLGKLEPLMPALQQATHMMLEKTP
jgi:hypothetical protein